MSVLALTIYALIWPVVVALVMFFIARAFLSEWREARRNGEDLV
ncbi:putative transporter small subunit [Glutamicibacter sp. MNS18]|nr:putative transporter small subunit [Glutamicibacter sp. MNS18]MCW4467005.1 putative transporter small subunit [Glutamicibacter sp. MNS18]